MISWSVYGVTRETNQTVWGFVMICSSLMHKFVSRFCGMFLENENIHLLFWFLKSALFFRNETDLTSD